MSLKQVPITFDVTLPDALEPASVTISAKLSKPDFDPVGDIVIQKELTASGDASGIGSISVWPNGRGTQGSAWVFTITSSGSVVYASPAIVVPDSDVPLSLVTMVEASTLAQKAGATGWRIMTKAARDAAFALDPAFDATLVVVIVG